MKSTDEDRQVIERLNGMFVGQLTEDELESFERCIQDHRAKRVYEGASGFMGLAKVKYYPSPTERTETR